MMTKMRISKTGKFAATFPKPIALKIRGIAADFGIKSCTLSERTPDKVFVVGEGESYFGCDETGKYASFETVSQNTIGASGVSHAINSQFQMPAGSWLIVVSYYGGYFMSVYKIVNLLED